MSQTPGRRTTRSTRGSTPVDDLGTAPSFSPRRSLSPQRSPRRNGRQQSPSKTALPPLASRSTKAYGGTGRLALSNGATTSAHTNLADAFNHAREAEAMADTINIDQSSPSRAPRGGRNARAASDAVSEASAGPSTVTKKPRGRPPKKQMTAVPEDDVLEARDDVSNAADNEDEEMTALSSKRHLSPARRGIRGSSMEGTTVMENSADYHPQTGVAQTTRRPNINLPGRNFRPYAIPAATARGPTQFEIVRRRARDTTDDVLAAVEAFVDRYWELLKFLGFLGLVFSSFWITWFYIPVPSVRDYVSLPSMPSIHMPTANVFEHFHPLSTVKDYASSTMHTVSGWTTTSGKKSDEVLNTSLSTYEYPWALDRRVKVLEDKVKELASVNKLHDHTIKQLQKILPDFIVIKGDADTGIYDIPDTFVAALKERLEYAANKTGQRMLWDVFIKLNTDQMKTQLEGAIEKTMAGGLTQMIVSSDEFIAALEDQYSRIPRQYLDDVQARIESRLLELQSTTESTALIASKKFFEERLEVLPEAQLSTIVAINMAKNTENALTQINYFSPGMGAVVNPMLTSTTFDGRERSWNRTKLDFWGWLGFADEYRFPHLIKPIQALEPWSEPGDCWCAGASKNAPKPPTNLSDPTQQTLSEAPKLQLAVLMPKTIYPERITIEHIPSKATMNIRSAPQKMELWVSIADPVARAAVEQRANELFTPEREYERPPASSREAGGDQALDLSYVRIGRWIYDIREKNHVQTFGVHVRLHEYGVGTNSVVIRATSNWGAEKTCLYRVRMHGTPVEGEERIQHSYAY